MGSNLDRKAIIATDQHPSPLPPGEGPGVGSNLHWETIISIEPAGEELVYDITVEGIHNFVGNGVILHNCVYQEQVMLLSQKLANFTKGEADVLRKAMGKKKKDVLDKMFPQFLEGGTSNGHPQEKLKKIWTDWEAFASYAFNKSHSTCYALVAYQTAYLKAHYPAEYMASVLTHNKSDITKLTFFLQECRRMGVEVLGPDINESVSDFSVNKQGQIRFGLSALKGVGEGPVEEILNGRRGEGVYESVFNLLQRATPGTLNKRVLESLALGGSFDCFEELHRAQYFAPSDKFDSYLEHLVKYANAYQAQKASAASSLFGAMQDEILLDEPPPPHCREWSLIEKLTKEKEVTGIYVSGHPLDDYRVIIDNYVTCGLDQIERHQRKSKVKVAGLVTTARHMISKNGNGWGIFEISDYDGSFEFKLFGEDYQKFKHLLEVGKAIYVIGNYQQRWKDANVEFRVGEIRLMEGLGENLTSAITIKIPLDSLDNDLVESLDVLCARRAGEHQLQLIVIDRKNRLKLQMAPKERRVQADDDFVAEVERLGLEYKVR